MLRSNEYFVRPRKLIVATIVFGVAMDMAVIAAESTPEPSGTNALSWKDVALLIVGVILGFLGNLLATHFYPSLRYRWRRWHLRRKRNGRIPPAGTVNRAKLSVGHLTVSYIVLATGRFASERIRCFYDDRPIPLQADIKRMRNDCVKDLKRRNKLGEANLPYNSPGYKLKEFDVGNREIIDGEEVPVLRFNFGPTDYFTQLVTDLNVGNPVRDKFAESSDCTVRPIPEFSSILGVTLVLVTRDNYLVVTDRNPLLQSGAGKLHCSVAENLLRPTDVGPNQAPDPFRAALRGAQEELGIVLKPEELEFIAFGVEPTLCQYTLIGWAQIDATAKELEELRALAVPKDKWENRGLIFLPCDISSIAKFVLQNEQRWVSFGLAAIIQFLHQIRFTKTEITKAFSRVLERPGS